MWDRVRLPQPLKLFLPCFTPSVLPSALFDSMPSFLHLVVFLFCFCLSFILYILSVVLCFLYSSFIFLFSFLSCSPSFPPSFFFIFFLASFCLSIFFFILRFLLSITLHLFSNYTSLPLAFSPPLLLLSFFFQSLYLSLVSHFISSSRSFIPFRVSPSFGSPVCVCHHFFYLSSVVMDHSMFFNHSVQAGKF